MEGGGGGRRRLSSRETSPERGRLLGYSQQQQQQQQQQRLLATRPPPVRKVQIVYYLSRNGQLEHPHFMELPHLPNQHIRLKDVIDRLTLLRGRGMPSLFSWSCKRSYKNGYVWNDLSENDVIYPADGAEYVLKGSEILQLPSERFERLQVGNKQPRPLPVLHSSRQHMEEPEEDEVIEEEEEEEGVVDETEEEYYKGGNHTGSAATRRRNHDAPHGPRCSRGVLTDEIDRVSTKPTGTRTRAPNQPAELPLDDASPPSSSSSDKPPPSSSGAGGGRRSEDGDQDGDPAPTRPGSVLLQLIACGSVPARCRTAGGGSTPVSAASPAGGGRRSAGGLHRGVVSRLASRAVAEEDELRCISENPRFGYPQVEDKEYFSGSIVEGSKAPPVPALKKSNSYNEERSSKLEIGEQMMEAGEEIGGWGGVKGKCIPGRRKSSGKPQQQQPYKGS